MALNPGIDANHEFPDYGPNWQRWAYGLQQLFLHRSSSTPTDSPTSRTSSSPPAHTKTTEHIEVTGARENNLRGVDVTIPKRHITVVTGVSGSGKSSLVFDTIAVEAQRQLNELLPVFVRGFLPALARPSVDNVANLPGVIVVDQQRISGGARSTLGTITDIAPILRLLFSRVGNPHIGFADAFSFNLPSGMCLECDGLGTKTAIDMGTFIDPTLSLNQGALQASVFAVGTHPWQVLVISGRFDPDTPVEEFNDQQLRELLYSTEGTVKVEYQGESFNASYEGAAAKFRRLYLEKDTEEMGARSQKQVEQFTTSIDCPECEGARLSQSALSSRIDGYNIAELSAMEVADLLEVLAAFDIPEAAPVINTLTQRIQHLVDLGLGYLRLDRATSTLSGGESQRVKIVRHLNSSLNDFLYIFDEPTIGLHAHDVHRLTDLLRSLRDKGNTVLVVEHDRDVIADADHIIDIGPHAGVDGGTMQFTGTASALAQSSTVTGRALREETVLKLEPRKPTGWLEVREASLHNLRHVDVDFPTGVLTAVTGVAGSGKSSLLHGAFAHQHPDAIIVDQSALHTNRRSTIATYTGASDLIRKAFAKANGVSVAWFSANSSGACGNCEGLGTTQTDLAFLDQVETTCELCKGRRFNDEALSFRLEGRSISDVLNLTVHEAAELFAAKRGIAKILHAVDDVGLGYLRLGQSLTTLSGGECQRIKLASHLPRAGSVFVLDEPTTGLHMRDVAQLLDTFNQLIDSRGASVIVIEHNLDVVAGADWVVDMGPEGGHDGGEVMFEGPPEELVETGNSHTATHLRYTLKGVELTPAVTPAGPP